MFPFSFIVNEGISAAYAVLSIFNNDFNALKSAIFPLWTACPKDTEDPNNDATITDFFILSLLFSINYTDNCSDAFLKNTFAGSKSYFSGTSSYGRYN